jgi:hypothetical protein
VIASALTACETPPVIGDFCHVYKYPGSLSAIDHQLASEVNRKAYSWTTAVITNKDSYEKQCLISQSIH